MFPDGFRRLVESRRPFKRSETTKQRVARGGANVRVTINLSAYYAKRNRTSTRTAIPVHRIGGAPNLAVIIADWIGHRVRESSPRVPNRSHLRCVRNVTYRFKNERKSSGFAVDCGFGWVTAKRVTLNSSSTINR